MTDLFTNNQTTVETTPNTNPYEELVGEGKKFKTNEDLAKAKLESDRFIQQLQNELSGLRTELSTRQTLEQLMDKISKPNGEANANQSHNQNSAGGDSGTVKSLTEEDIARLVEQRLSQAEKARIHTANMETVREALVASFGSDYVTHLKAKASELGVSEEYLNSLAKETPKAFLKLVDASGERKATTPGLFTPPPSSGLPSPSKQGFAPNGARKNSWYEQLKATDKTKYLSKEVQLQMYNDAMSLGESFFDTP